MLEAPVSRVELDAERRLPLAGFLEDSAREAMVVVPRCACHGGCSDARVDGGRVMRDQRKDQRGGRTGPGSAGWVKRGQITPARGPALSVDPQSQTRHRTSQATATAAARRTNNQLPSDQHIIPSHRIPHQNIP